MEECELCGAQTKNAYVVNVEDVELRVCAKCAQGKKVLSKPSYKIAAKATRPKREEDQPLVENYGKVIRAARDRMDLPLKVLAEMLNEKETLLSRVEQQSTLPTMKLMKKTREGAEHKAHRCRGGRGFGFHFGRKEERRDPRGLCKFKIGLNVSRPKQARFQEEA